MDVDEMDYEMMQSQYIKIPTTACTEYPGESSPSICNERELRSMVSSGQGRRLKQALRKCNERNDLLLDTKNSYKSKCGAGKPPKKGAEWNCSTSGISCRRLGILKFANKK